MSEENQTKKYRGIDVAGLKYFVNDESWAINPSGHLPKYSEEIQKITGEFAEKAKTAQSGKITTGELVTQAKEVNKKILKVALIQKDDSHPDGFDFDSVVEKYGWKVIDGMVVDLKIFLVDYGGKEEYLLLKQRYIEANQSGLYGIEG